jgi:hypothetical protein
VVSPLCRRFFLRSPASAGLAKRWAIEIAVSRAASSPGAVDPDGGDTKPAEPAASAARNTAHRTVRRREPHTWPPQMS